MIVKSYSEFMPKLINFLKFKLKRNSASLQKCTNTLCTFYFYFDFHQHIPLKVIYRRL